MSVARRLITASAIAAMFGAGLTLGAGLAPSPARAQATGKGVGRSETAKAALPGVPTRRNPFWQNSDIQRVIDAIPRYPPPLAPVAPGQDLYAEIRPPQDANEKVSQQQVDDAGGPPIPPMRVAAVLQGSITSALLQIGSEIVGPVTPGKMIPEDNPIYRVERIEREKVILSHRWKIGERKGVQRIEVNLAGNPAAAGGYPQPGGYPGSGYPMGAGSSGMGRSAGP